MTLILIKPDAVRRGLVGNIINDFELNEFEIIRIGRFDDPDKLREHYEEHEGNPYYDNLIAKTSGPLVAMVLLSSCKLTNTVSCARQIVGPYKNREPRTLRYKYAIDETQNSIHSSDSEQSAAREINIWFRSKS